MSDYSTEALEAGHVWLNNILQNGSNHIRGERMLQVMATRTTEEHVVSSEPDLQEACGRADAKTSPKSLVWMPLSDLRGTVLKMYYKM